MSGTSQRPLPVVLKRVIVRADGEIIDFAFMHFLYSSIWDKLSELGAHNAFKPHYATGCGPYRRQCLQPISRRLHLDIGAKKAVLVASGQGTARIITRRAGFVQVEQPEQSHYLAGHGPANSRFTSVWFAWLSAADQPPIDADAATHPFSTVNANSYADILPESASPTY